MKLTPQAIRHILACAPGLPGDDQVRLRRWFELHQSDNVPQDIASLIIQVLTAAAKRIEALIDSGRLDEDQEADAANDLGFITSIVSGLRMDKHSRTAAE